MTVVSPCISRVWNCLGCDSYKARFEEMNNMIRRHITFYGWVQGVGFRYRAHHAAVLYGCTGWERNEWDGSVTMEIQGTEEIIDKVID